MAQYLIIHEGDDDTTVREVEAKNIKEAARTLVTDDAPNTFTARIWRVTGPSKTITLRVKTSIDVEVT